MKIKPINAPDAPAAAGSYAQAISLSGASEALYISGQIPVTVDGSLPKGFRAQADQAWANIDAQLRAADMTRENLVKATIFLADRAHTIENREARAAYLGDHVIGLTVIICGIFDSDWLLEIEAIAAR